MRNRKHSSMILVALALAAQLAQAQVGGSSAPSTAAQGPDATFIQQAGQSSMAAIELSRLAGTASDSDTVRRAAQRIVWDQTRSNGELARIAARENIQLPKTLDVDDERLLDALSTRRGPDFDRAYLQAMREHQERLVVLLNSAEATVSTDELRAYVKRNLPVVEAQLEMTSRR